MAALLDANQDPSRANDENAKTLWMGDLAYWMDENFMYSLFVPTGALQTVKIIRNKASNASEGYGFVEFATHAAAEDVLQTLNGTPIPNTDQIFRLNWAAFGVGKQTQEGTDNMHVDHSIFVGDLAPEVTDYMLQEHFRQYYPSVRSAKVIADSVSNRSKGYGFVRFGSEQERDMALGQMNGIHINNRPIRVSLATAKKNPGQITAAPVAQPPHPSDFDPTNTTLFIGGLSGGVTEEQLRSVFAAYGDIVYVKVPPGKGCGFVQFVQRAAAESAMGHMQGQLLGSSSIRISWGRSNSSRSQAAAATTHTPSYAYSTYTAPATVTAASYAGYDTNLLAQYGYAAPSVDPYAAYYASIQQADPYQGYQQMLPAAAAVSAAAAAALPTKAISAKTNGLFDPLGPLDVDALNAAYIQKHQAALLGSHLRL